MCVRGFEDAGTLWIGILDLLLNGEDGKGKNKRKPLGKGVSSYQLFKSALDCLARMDWGSAGATMVKSESGKRFESEEFGGGLVDSTGLVNVVSGVPLGSLALVSSVGLSGTGGEW